MDAPIQYSVNLHPACGLMSSGMESTGGEPMISDDALLLELEGDVPSLANQAATELDNLIIGRGGQVTAIRQFVALLRSELTSPISSPLRRMPVKATTMVVMNRAISEVNIGTPAKNVAEVVAKVGKVAESLEMVAADPAKAKAANLSEIERLRTFCLAYSKSVSASQRTRNERPRHPFRR